MHITVIIVFFYIVSCCVVGAAPWRFSQVNARYFSRSKGIFSKLAIDNMIPERWRLTQSVDSENITPASFPVFLKPEWGQNGSGIVRADDAESLTESTNSAGEQFPINSIYNKSTVYRDITSQFSDEQLARLSGYILEIGDLAIARVSVRADSTEKLLAGEFKIIEVNMFIPMPINVMDPSYSWVKRLRFLFKAMMHLAKATRNRRREHLPPPILYSMVMYARSRAVAAKLNTRTLAQQRGARAAAGQRNKRHPIGNRRTHP